MKHNAASVRTKRQVILRNVNFVISKVAKPLVFKLRKYLWVRGLVRYGGTSVKTKDGLYPEIPIWF